MIAMAMGGQDRRAKLRGTRAKIMGIGIGKRTLQKRAKQGLLHRSHDYDRKALAPLMA